VRASGFARMAADRDGLTAVISWTEAVPQNPENPKSPASTRIRTARITAGQLVPSPGTAVATAHPLAIVRGDVLALLEVCAPVDGTHPSTTDNP
jgi:hypothetical protein